jgi:hypothetical protein
MPLTSVSLRKAAEVTAKIEALQDELDSILGQGRDITMDTKTGTVPPRARKRKIGARKPRRARGALREAVAEVLKKSTKPLKAAQIYEQLVQKKSYPDNPKSKKILGIRLYKLAGVKSLGKGLFAAA